MLTFLDCTTKMECAQAFQNSIKRSAKQNTSFPPKKQEQDDLQTWCKKEMQKLLHGFIAAEVDRNQDNLTMDEIIGKILKSEEYKMAHQEINSQMTKSMGEAKAEYLSDLTSSDLQSLPSSSISSRSMFYTRDQLEALFSDIEHQPR